MRIQLEGTKALDRKLAAVRDAGPAAVNQVLFETGHQILAVAVENHVPVDTGALKNSAHLEYADTGSEFIVTIGFGGPAADYALYVHEDLIARHIVGEAKYLEIPFRAAVEGMSGTLKVRAKGAIDIAMQQGRYDRLREPKAIRTFIRQHSQGGRIADLYGARD